MWGKRVTKNKTCFFFLFLSSTSRPQSLKAFLIFFHSFKILVLFCLFLPHTSVDPQPLVVHASKHSLREEYVNLNTKRSLSVRSLYVLAALPHIPASFCMLGLVEGGKHQLWKLKKSYPFDSWTLGLISGGVGLQQLEAGFWFLARDWGQVVQWDGRILATRPVVSDEALAPRPCRKEFPQRWKVVKQVKSLLGG